MRSRTSPTHKMEVVIFVVVVVVVRRRRRRRRRPSLDLVLLVSRGQQTQRLLNDNGISVITRGCK